MAETSNLYKWGQALAVLKASTPGGISPEIMVLAVERPLPSLGQLRAKAMPTEEENARLAELLGEIGELPEQLKNEDQGPVWLGYYNEAAKLPRPGEAK